MKIAILGDSFPHSRSHADPDKLASVFVSAGYKTDIINAVQLADPEVFNTANYWLVVLPYGPYFPASSLSNFLTYLRSGGDFLSTGGYAFDSPVINWQGKWMTRKELLETVPTSEVDVGSESDGEYLIGEWHDKETSQGEWGEKEGNKRWTGKSAGLRLTVTPGKAYTLEISLSANPDATKYRRRILINGHPVTDIPAEREQLLQIPINAKLSNGNRRLDVIFDVELWCPRDLGTGSDGRSLGVAVNKVRLIPEDGKPEASPDMSDLLRPINMRHGKAADFLEWNEEQLGVFDAGYRLSGGRVVIPASGQYVIPADYKLKGNIEGWAAAGTTGSGWYWTTPADRSRLIPLLETNDEFGRFRGNAGALMINHLPPYRASIWAYFGIEDRDIFSSSGGDKLLLSVVEAMSHGVFIHDTRTSYACYREGEEVVLYTKVSNFGDAAKKATVYFDINEESGNSVFLNKLEIELMPGETRELASKWHPGHFRDDFYKVNVELHTDSGKSDVELAAFYVWNEDTLSNGMDLSYAGNYLRDGGIPGFLLGVQAFYPTKTVTGRNALYVERDFAQMADMGLHISRAFTRGERTEEDRRFADALVMASQHHRVAFFFEGVADFNSYLRDPEMGNSAGEAIGERYRGVPGMMIDLQNEPNFGMGDDAERDKRFNEYLRRIYANKESLRSAWGTELGEEEKLGTIKMGWMNADWTSIRSRDVYRFMLEDGSRWVKGVTGRIKAKDPKRLVSVGYLHWWPVSMVMDSVATSDGIDFINRHWYGKASDLKDFDANLAMSDRRYCGMAPSVGEFGSKTFPTFAETGHNFDTPEQQELRYLHIGHYTLALGGIFACNWHWRDPVSSIFPYGIVHSDGTLKPVAKAYRAMSLLFSTLRPRYVSPEVFLVMPDESRFGGGSTQIFQAVQRAAYGLMEGGIRFGAIGEWDLDRLPREARVVIVPSPFALSEKGYQNLRSFVQKGGTSYISGDISFDEKRRRTQMNRLEELTGAKFVRELYPDVRFNAARSQNILFRDGLSYAGNPCLEFELSDGTEVIATGDEKPVAVRRRFGSGNVVYLADPVEFSDDAPLAAIYSRVCSYAGLKPERIESTVKGIHVFRLPLESGGEAVIVGNPSDKTAKVKLVLQGHEYSVKVGANRQAMLVSQGGRLVGMEAQGNVIREGRPVVTSHGHFFIVSLDGKDITASAEMAMVPLDKGAYSLNRTDLIAEVGELDNGKWKKLADIVSDSASFSIPGSLARDLVIFSSNNRSESAKGHLIKLTY